MDIIHNMVFNVSQQQIAKIKNWLGTGSINIFGWPFSGKDTQGRRLTEMFDAVLIGGGEILRSRKDIPKHVRKAVNAGDLAPMDEYLKIVTPYLSKEEYVTKPIIMNSLGRWHGEEPTILNAALTSGHPIKVVVDLKLDEATAHDRAENSKKAADRGQRADDAAEYLHTRYQEFRNKTVPVIEFYRQKGLMVEVDGSASRDEVTQQIINGLVDFIDRSGV